MGIACFTCYFVDDRVSLLQRLFSTFARGRPGAGLMLMRFVAGMVLLRQVLSVRQSLPAGLPLVLVIAEVSAGLMLILGVWTPIGGVAVVALEFWRFCTHPGEFWIPILVGTLGGALALIGPGAWSVDAHLFGRKRIDLREGQD
jgi:putative oxidoreductase